MSGTEIDVIVVGAGGAGLIAALTAREHGARVVVAESEGLVGGASRLSAGALMAVNSPVQQAAGIEDDPADLFQDYMFANQYRIKPGIVRRICSEGGEGVAWLAGHGVQFFPELMQGGGERVPRTHVPMAEIGGQHTVDVLAQRCREEGVEIALGNKVDRLLMREGAVTGVVIAGEDYEAGAVVLTTGGFGANRKLIAEHLPSLDKYGDKVWYIGPDSSRGDGLALGEQAGAQLVGHDTCLPLLTPEIQTRESEAYLPGWMLLLGPDGRRVMDETSPYGQTHGIAKAAGDVVFGIFDAQTLADNGTAGLPTFKLEFPAGSPMPSSVYSSENITRLLETGAVVRADTLDELAGLLGIPQEALAGSVARYNGWAAGGEDRDFLKASRFLRPVATAPFYGMPIRPVSLGFTSYGVEIDDEARVLDPCSEPVDGLFAAGEVTGGVIGTGYLGSGNMWANLLVFGRRAGRSAASYALSGAPAANA